MGTRSTIAIEYADGTVDQVYCHWDGYLKHNGAILLEHYSDPYKLRDLIDLGDISSLGKEIGIKHPFSPIGVMSIAEYDKLYKDMTTFYGRDRDETGVGARRFKSFEDYRINHQYEEFEYILRNVNGKAQWFVDTYRHDGEYMTIEDAMRFQAARARY